MDPILVRCASFFHSAGANCRQLLAELNFCHSKSDVLTTTFAFRAVSFPQWEVSSEETFSMAIKLN